MITTPIQYYGGKVRMADFIISLFPPHKTYVEVFGGSGAVLFAKPRSDFEIYNDIDADLVNLFQTIRGDESNKLFAMLTNTLTSRAEFYAAIAMKKARNYKNTIERAWMTFVIYNQSISATGRGWAHGRQSRKPAAFAARVLALDKMRERLQHVQIENSSFHYILETYDHEDTLFYLDPPYTRGSRSDTAKKQYQHEMNPLDHEQLIDDCLKLRGNVILSGYETETYKPLEDAGWSKLSLSISCHAATQTELTRTETLWYKTLAPTQLSFTLDDS